MPDDLGLDTSIPPTGWQEPEGQDTQRSSAKQRRRKAPAAQEEPKHSPRPEPADGVGTKIDVVV